MSESEYEDGSGDDGQAMETDSLYGYGVSKLFLVIFLYEKVLVPQELRQFSGACRNAHVLR
jgi:hypothetical protein